MDGRGTAGDWELQAPGSLSEICRETIAGAIRSGKLRPGERIVEANLAQMLGVSRGSLREALKALEAQHLIETHRSRGSFVARVTREQMVQMMVARAALEGMAARLVAERADPRALQGLARLRKGMAQAAKAGQLQQARDLNMRFHEGVCEAAGNEFILRSWRSLSDLLRLFMHENKAFEQSIATVLDNNMQLFSALKTGDGNEAEAVFRRLIIASAEAHLQVVLSPAGSPPGTPTTSRRRKPALLAS